MAVASTETKNGTDPSVNSEKSPIAPDSNKEQYLFLLESFIHYITGERLAKLNQTFLVPTSVTLQFLNVDDDDAVEITPVDATFEPRAGNFTKDTEIFNVGRSILFSIPQKVVINKNAEFKIKLKVFKKMPELNNDILIGNGQLDLTQEFSGLRKEMFQCWNRNVPPPKIYEGPIEIFFEGQLAAMIFVFIRISAFGQSIVTEFDTPDCRDKDKQSFIFRGDENYDETLAYNCKIISESLLDVYKSDINNEMYYNEMKPGAMYYCSPCGYPSGANVIGLTDDTCQVFKDDLMLKTVREKYDTTQSGGGKLYQLCGKPVMLKVSGLIDQLGNVIKPSENQTKSYHIDYDVFVLRIGKKGIVGDGEKADFQIEMKTPKAPERRPPIRYETREMQTGIEDAGATGKAKSGKIKKKKMKKKKGKVKEKKKKKKK